MEQDLATRIEAIKLVWRSARQGANEAYGLAQEEWATMIAEVDAGLVKDALQRTAALTNDLTIIREEVQLCSQALAVAEVDVDVNDTLLDVMHARRPLISQLLDLDATHVAFELISEIPSAEDGDDFCRDMLYRWLIEGLMLRHQVQVANQVAEQAFATNGYELFKARLKICEFDPSAEQVEAARVALPRAVAATKLCVTNPPIFWAQVYALSQSPMDLKRARDLARMLTPFSRAAAFSGIASRSGERSDYVEAFRACHEIASEQDRVRRVDAILTALYVAQNSGYIEVSGNVPLSARDFTQLVRDVRQINPRWSRALLKKLSKS